MAFHARLPFAMGGFLGVDVFFVLSGFLITSLLLEEYNKNQHIDVLAFYKRRSSRLYPALLTVVLAYLLLSFLFPADQGSPLLNSILALTYTSNYSYAYFGVPQVLLHSWSLSHEMQFYLLWPFIIYGLVRLPLKYSLSILILLFSLSVFWCFYVLETEGFKMAYYRLDTRSSGLIIGSILAFVPVGIRSPTEIPKNIQVLLCFIALGVLYYAFVTPSWKRGFGLKEMIILSELSTVILIVYSQNLKIFAIPPIVWIGKMSYGIYLWHYPIVYYLRAQEIFSPAHQFWISFLGSIPLAFLSYHLVEKRFHQPLSLSKSSNSV